MQPSDFTKFDILAVPDAEDDKYEFKSSKTPIKELSKKIACAASAFGNSGGGVFLAGVDSAGNADGGIPNQIGRQTIRDWSDQILRQVASSAVFFANLINDCGSLNATQMNEHGEAV